MTSALFADAADSGRRIAMENRPVLGDCDLARRLDDRIGVEVLCPAIERISSARRNSNGTRSSTSGSTSRSRVSTLARARRLGGLAAADADR